MSTLPKMFQTTTEQEQNSEDNRFIASIVSRSLLTRQSIARKLSLVGITVFEYRHVDALLQSVDSAAPHLVLIDSDDQELEWTALVSLLKMLIDRTYVILLVSSLNADHTVEAAINGVAAIFVKPYKEEEHTERILDLMNDIRRISPKRLLPRYTPDLKAQIHLEYLPSNDGVIFPIEVRNISQKGAQLLLPYGDFAKELQPGSSGFPATLLLGALRVGVYLRVVYRQGRTVGVVFEHIGDRRKAFATLIRELSNRALGDIAGDRRW